MKLRMMQTKLCVLSGLRVRRMKKVLITLISSMLVAYLNAVSFPVYGSEAVETLEVGDAKIHLLIEEQSFAIGRDELRAWVF